MNLSDLLIIYFACAAPFAVNYFFQNRTASNPKKNLMRCAFAFVFWLPFALKLWLQSKGGRKSFAVDFEKKHLLDARDERNVQLVQKKMEDFFSRCDSNRSIFEFREVLERYAGLTLASQNESNEPRAAEENLFRIAGGDRINVSAKCLQRRNRKRLLYHQNLARRDFLRILTELSDFDSVEKKLGNLSIEFVTLLNDIEAHRALERLVKASQQTADKFAVKGSETDVWNRETPKPLNTSQISLHLQTLTAKANSRSKD